MSLTSKASQAPSVPHSQPLPPLEEIRADILALERETEGLLAEIVGVGS